MAQTFSFIDEENGIDLSRFSYIDTMVTVVDAFNFFKDFGSTDMLLDRDLTDIEGDYRNIADLLADQVEFANVILLNKIDLVTEIEVKMLRAAIQKLNPSTGIIETMHSKVAPETILNTKLFDFEEAEQSAGWMEELEKGHHIPETEEYGISSFVFKTKRPFNPDRFLDFTQELPDSIIRSKGLFWLASRGNQALIWGHAGGSLNIESAGVWWSSMPEYERMQYMSYVDNQVTLEADWHYTFGDRKIEIVFIGQNMDQFDIKDRLQRCLATDDELETLEWQVGYGDRWSVERVQD